jgi:hypothetical protein
MLEPITLTMLGGTKTGKTCFLVAMYGIMRRGYNGFSFRTQNPDIDLDLAAEWKALRIKTDDDRWPKGTQESTDYYFDFSHAYKPILAFTWHDYRGSIIDEKGTKERVTLIERLRKTDCVLLCFSSEHLQDPSGRVSEDGEDEAATMSALMSEVGRAAEQRGGRLPSVVIVLTKYDLMAGRPRDLVMKEMQRLFNPLFTKVDGWTVTVCPVSLGKELAKDAGRGRVEPICVHLPVSFAVYMAIQKHADEAAVALQGSQEHLSKRRQENWLKRVFRGTNLPALESVVSHDAARLADLKAKLSLLVEEVGTGLTIFQNGVAYNG